MGRHADLLPNKDELCTDKLVSYLQRAFDDLVGIEDVSLRVIAILRQENQQLEFKVIVNYIKTETVLHQLGDVLQLRCIVYCLHYYYQLVKAEIESNMLFIIHEDIGGVMRVHVR
jgi:hypothetical protein